MQRLEPVRLFNYPGNKVRVLPWILPLIEQSDKRIYVEPFFGSGNVWLNLPERKWIQMLMGDTVPYILDFYSYLGREEGDWHHDRLIRHLISINERWPVCPSPPLKRKLVKNEPLTPNEKRQVEFLKGNYYAFRQYWNELKGTATKGDPEVVAGFAYLCGACINNLVRFGRGGDFNQGWGQRMLDIREVDTVRKHILPRMLISHFDGGDFNTLLTQVSGHGHLGDAIIYMDPPYGTRTEADTNGLYHLGNGWSENHDVRVEAWCMAIHNAGGHFILSNILENPGMTKLLAYRFFRTINVPLVYKASVGKHEARAQREVLITNIPSGEVARAE